MRRETYCKYIRARSDGAPYGCPRGRGKTGEAGTRRAPAVDAGDDFVAGDRVILEAKFSPIRLEHFRGSSA